MFSTTMMALFTRTNGGRIELIIGPMFSGKTTELMRRIRALTIAKKKAHVINYSKDLRYPGSDSSVVTHDGVSYPATLCGANDLENVVNSCQSFDVIGIDEGHFFRNLFEVAELFANQGKIVIIAGLNSTFERKDFGDIPKLLSVADDMTFLHAICSICYNQAACSKRITKSTELELIGGSDKYEARCRHCFYLT